MFQGHMSAIVIDVMGQNRKIVNERYYMNNGWVGKLAISVAAMLVAFIHHHFALLTDDTITWMLMFLAALPWLYSMVEEASGPGGWKVRFRSIEQQQGQVMEMLVTFSMSGYIYGTLQNIYFAQRGSRAMQYNSQTEKEHLQFLQDHGYINYIDFNSLEHGDNLAEKVVITPAGKTYVQLRERKETKSDKLGINVEAGQ